MESRPDESSRRDQLVNQVIAAYHESVDAGEHPDPKAIVALYRDIAQELQEYFANQDRLEQVAQPIRCDARNPIGDALTLPPAEEMADVKPVPLAGRRIREFGDYQLLDEIGRGGMGVVYRARQVSLQRVVALKMILDGQLASADAIRRFRMEAESAAKLDHPGIVPIYEIGTHEGHHYFSMAYVHGTSLQERLQQGPLPAREAARLLAAISEAVQYAHDHGIVHRDLKPANILLEMPASVESGELSSGGSTSTRQSSAVLSQVEGVGGVRGPSGTPKVTLAVPYDSSVSPPGYRARITDFGLARRLDVDSQHTRSGQILGTPYYMSPEQAAGAQSEIGPATDIYALGAVLYHVLAGRPPFQGASPVETLGQVLDANPLPPHLLNAAVPRDLEAICLKCLEKDIRNRYPSAHALCQDLTRYLEGEPVHAASVNVWDRVARIVRRSRHEEHFQGWGLALLIFGVIILLAHVAIYLLGQSGQGPLVTYFVPRLVMFAALLGVLRYYRPHSVLPTNPAERLVWVTWIGYLLSLGAVNSVRFVVPGSEVESYAIFAILAGLGFFVLGAHIWGGGYVVGVLFMVTAPALARAGSAAPLLFGATWAVAMTAFGWHYWQRGGTSAFAHAMGVRTGVEATEPPKTQES